MCDVCNDLMITSGLLMDVEVREERGGEDELFGVKQDGTPAFPGGLEIH